MLRNTIELRGYVIAGTDGEIGSVSDLLFDDQTWTVRYFLVKTSAWMGGRETLISPIALGGLADDLRLIQTTLSREQVRNSPPLEPGAPITTAYEEEYYRYYSWPVYWSDINRWGAGPYPSFLLSGGRGREVEERSGAGAGDPNLRSVGEVAGYVVRAQDGELGCVNDFLVDDDTWALRYLIVNAHEVASGRLLLLSPHWIGDIDWERRTVTANETLQRILAAPPYDPSRPVDGQYEQALARYYGVEGEAERPFVRRSRVPSV